MWRLRTVTPITSPITAVTSYPGMSFVVTMIMVRSSSSA
jgi:hypothetical protein